MLRHNNRVFTLKREEPRPPVAGGGCPSDPIEERKLKSIITFVAALACVAGMSDSRQAEAAPYRYAAITYEVQVEYWFFDTTSYHWSTIYSTNDKEDAEFVYNLLLVAKENGQLNRVAPNDYWRYIAVDVRMITKWQFAAPRNSYQYKAASSSALTPTRSYSARK